jgi:hypothetical protein
MNRKTLGGMVRPLTVIGALTLAACDTPIAPSPLDGASKDLAAARRTWATQGLLSYRFRFQRLCFCAPDAVAPLSVVVTRNRVISVTRAESGTPVTPDSSLPLTVERLFDEIERAIHEKAASLNVRYDPLRGYPLSIDIDRDERVADEEVYYRASDLTPLSGTP